MKNKAFLKLVSLVSAVTLLIAAPAWAGGGGSGPTTNDIPQIICHPADPAQTMVRELMYFVREEVQFGFHSARPGLVLSGDLFSVTIYSSKDDLFNIDDLASGLPPDVVPKGFLSAFGWNVRSMKIQVQGSHLYLTLVAGALGQNKLNQMKMNCEKVTAL